MKNIQKLSVLNITKKYDRVDVVNNVSMSVEKSQFFALLGPSGSGKTTLLRIIAGFVKPDNGKIFIGNKDITNVPSNKRNTAMVFQNFSLWPHMNVFENVAFGLRLRKFPDHIIKERVYKILSMVHLEQYTEKKPQHLSGGQQQRVALARALVIEPEILLLDEPLSNLDAHLRDELRQEIKTLQQNLDITTIYVTHDQKEAMLIADIIAIMMNGSIVETDSPEVLYQKPKSIETASFLGELNKMQGTINACRNNFCLIETPAGILKAKVSSHFAASEKVIIGFRPEFLHPASEKGENTIECEVFSVEYTGSTINAHLKTNNQIFKANFSPLSFRLPKTGKLLVMIRAEHMLVFRDKK